MEATSVPLASAQPDQGGQAGSEDVILYFGIIDILQVSCEHPCTYHIAHACTGLSLHTVSMLERRYVYCFCQLSC